MLRNYFLLALRTLLKNGRYTLINVLGLATGITCCLLILLYVADERGYDRHWPNGGRIYRMSLERIYPDRRTGYAIVPPSYAQSVKNECPEVEAVTRIADFNRGGVTVFKVGEQTFEETNLLAADSTFFRVFKIPMLHGNPETALTDPDGVVLTASTARRYFGKTEVLGQIVQLPGGNQVRQLAVAGVCEDLPENAHFTFDILMPTKGVRFLEALNHISFAANTYFLLHPGADAKGMEAKFPEIVEKYAAGEIQRNFGVSWEEFKKTGNGYRYYLTQLRDIHLHSNLESELKTPGNATTTRVFTLVALFILLIACVNFMNLATARSAERAREVGLRKTLGGERKQLIGQFLLEAMLVSACATLLAAGLTTLTLPAFNELAGKNLGLSQYADGRGIAGLLLFTLAVGLVAGSYPAGVLSGFRPAEVLKGQFTKQKRGVALRNGLVVFQFAISILMLVSTIVVFRRLQFISEKQLGFQKEHVVTIANGFFLGPKTEAFKAELRRIAGAISVGGASETPGGPNYFGTSFKKPEDNESVTGRCAVVDENYLQTLGMELLAGRGFSKDFNDSLSVILNERAATDLALGPDPVGKTLVMPGSFFDPNEGDVQFTVIGVVRDFHFQSLHENIVPLFLVYHQVAQRTNNTLVARIQPEQFQGFIPEAEKLWNRMAPERPFHYSFLDDNLAKLYAAEQREQRIFGLFALLAVFIACIGLLGLAAYMTRQRTKEIGIRKVLGASVMGITGLLAKDFLLLVILSLVIATPVAWYFMDRWLSDFAYRIHLEWWMFGAAGATAVAIAFLTVSFQSITAALANPVKALRSE
ncbi:MAG: ABC transporter permease [Thermoanaerobaculia bacterium]|nr:ABC transporter permease [Thermoanaerobaculia bacterium]